MDSQLDTEGERLDFVAGGLEEIEVLGGSVTGEMSQMSVVLGRSLVLSGKLS